MIIGRVDFLVVSEAIDGHVVEYARFFVMWVYFYVIVIVGVTKMDFHLGLV